MILSEWVSLWDRVRGGWLCADGFAGVAHPVDGRYAFLHGDTFWRVEGRTWATRNSMTVWDPAEGALHAVEPVSSSLIPEDEDPDGVPVWYWHGDMMWDGPDLWVIPHRLRATSSGWGFESFPPRDLVQLAWPSFRDPFYVARYPLPFGSGRVQWGASLLRCVGTNWIYVYGARSEPGWYGHDVFVARVRSGHLLNADRWRFFAGNDSSGSVAWSVDESAAVPTIVHGSGPSGTFSSDASAGGRFRITSKTPGDFGSSVVVWESVSPVGPWTRRTVANVPWTSADQTYGAFAHPGLGVLGSGKRLVSVNHNTNRGLKAIMDDPSLYRPSWHEVPE